MSAWKLRHEGSPQSIEGLSLPQILEGLQDGRWEATDEVMGPQDKTWVAIENHPQLAQVAADLEPPPPRVYDDETRLDMNALIDVCLVLLIFFILTTTYAVMQKRLDAPNATAAQAGPVTITKEVVENQMIQVSIAMEKKQPVIRIEQEVVPPEMLEAKLTAFVRSSKKTKLLLDYSPDVPQRSVVEVIDAARGAHVEGVSVLAPENR
jgi:biopolymer transport protein ExbD